MSVMEFTTHGRSPRARTDAWRRFASDAILATACTTLSDDGARVSMRQLRGDGLVIAEGENDQLVMDRSPESIAARPSGTVMLILLLAGEAFHMHRDGIVMLAPGDAMLCDNDAPGTQGHGAGTRIITVQIDRGEFRALTGVEELGNPIVIRGFGSDDAPHAPRVRMLRSAIEGSSRQDDGERAARDLVVLAAEHGGDRPARTVAIATEHIRRHLADPALSVRRIARAVAVSERQLARVFAASGTSVGSTIIRARMQRARALLADPAHAGESIAGIGVLVGYPSPSSFTHAYRRHFGRSPSSERRAPRSAGRVDE